MLFGRWSRRCPVNAEGLSRTGHAPLPDRDLNGV